MQFFCCRLGARLDIAIPRPRLLVHCCLPEVPVNHLQRYFRICYYSSSEEPNFIMLPSVIQTTCCNITPASAFPHRGRVSHGWSQLPRTNAAATQDLRSVTAVTKALEYGSPAPKIYLQHLEWTLPQVYPTEFLRPCNRARNISWRSNKGQPFEMEPSPECG